MAFRRTFRRRFRRVRRRFNRSKVGLGTRVLRPQSYGSRATPLVVRQTSYVATRTFDNQAAAENTATRLVFAQDRGGHVNATAGYSGQYRSAFVINLIPSGGRDRHSSRIMMKTFHLSASIYYNPAGYAGVSTSAADYIDRSYLFFIVYLPDACIMTDPPELTDILQSPARTYSEMNRDGIHRPKIIWVKRGRLVLTPAANGAAANEITYACGKDSRVDFDVKIPLNLPAVYVDQGPQNPIPYSSLISGKLVMYCVANMQNAIGVNPYIVFRSRLGYTDV